VLYERLELELPLLYVAPELLYVCVPDDLYVDDDPELFADAPVYLLTGAAGLRWFCGVPAAPLDALTLAGVLALTLDAVVLDTLLTVVLPAACVRDAVDMLAVAIPPLVDTLLVKTLSEPVLYLDPCQLSSLMWIGW
jgi:hypothetical protein